MKCASLFFAVLATAASVPYVEYSHTRVTASKNSSGWDYIIVGGGPAGIIVAERLTEQNKRVLLIERGGPSFASTGGNATTSWDSHGLTPFDVPSQLARVFSGGYASACGDTPGTAGCLLGGVSLNVRRLTISLTLM